jgi:hypothetical protein
VSAAVYCESHTTCTNALWVQSAEFEHALGCEVLTQPTIVYTKTRICLKLADKKFSKHKIPKVMIRIITSKYCHEVKSLRVTLLVTAGAAINKLALKDLNIHFIEYVNYLILRY